MAMRKHTPEQVIKKLREAEVATANGSMVVEAVPHRVASQQLMRHRRRITGVNMQMARRRAAGRR